MSVDAAIEVTGLSKAYRRGVLHKKSVLIDLSFRVAKGSVYGFLGHNGAGKSTTIKALLNFVQPDAGTVRILGSSPTDPNARRRVGFLPETADYYSFMSPRRLLHIYGNIIGLDRRDRDRRIDSLLDSVGLSREKDEKIGTFSKGMKQRVGIAQALLNEPELLILDEPASGLDPLGQREIRDLILEQKRLGRTIFFSSHELSEIEAVCDEAAIIRMGRMVRSGTLGELVPYREDLVARLRNAQAADVAKKEYCLELRPSLYPEETAFIAKQGITIAQLAQRLQADGFDVVSIGAVRDTLEEIFLEIMKEGGQQ